MDTFTAQIYADGGLWRETEILGNQALVKVRATVATLGTIAGTSGFRRIPLEILDDPLSSLTSGQRTAIRNEMLNAGYSAAEVANAIPDLASATLRQVLQLLARRRLKPRYDIGTNTIILDGAVQPCISPEQIDREVI